jgi:hypothetical protein
MLGSNVVKLSATNSLINAICLNNKTRKYLTKKVELSLLFLPIITTNFKASSALLRCLAYLIEL